MDYKNKKVLSIGAVSQLTELSLRQIRYYEDRKLIHPERTKGGTRQYSFSDVETLIQISNKLKEGSSTYEIKESNKAKQTSFFDRKIIQGQINAHFRRQ